MDLRAIGRYFLKKYEIIYIFDPQDEITEKTIEDVKGYLKKIDAKITKEEEMGKRKLAHEINKKTDGFYYVTWIEIEDYTRLQEFERELKFNPNVLRHMKFRV